MEHNGRSISAKNANLIMAAIAFINGGGGGCEVCL